MGGILLLLALCVVMALASFLAGAVPLSMTLSQSQLRLLSSIGVGILVGTSLIVIIPEGIEAAMSPSEGDHVHKARSIARRAPWASGLVARGFEDTTPSVALPEQDKFEDLPTILISRASHDALERRLDGPAPDIPGEPKKEDEEQKEKEKQKEEAEKEKTPEEHKDDEEHHEEQGGKGEEQHQHKEEAHAHVEVPTFEIGFSLILGFVLMFLIDRLPRHATDSLHQAPQTRHISLDNLGGDTASVDEEAEGFLGSLAPTPRRARSLATTTGLVIHAAADGIAMGASATTSDMKLGFIIFIAIMIHKAPAAFGLTSVLLKQGLSKRAARGHLVVFSLAAPVGALGTWMLITLLGGGNLEGDTGQWWTGMLLLFSGGTFLYVAMHAMQEDGKSHDHSTPVNGYAESSANQRKPKGPQMRDTMATMVGMLVPLLTQFGHHH